MNLNQLFQQATQVHQQGDITQAEQLYRQLLNLVPNQADAHHLLGIIYSQQEQHLAAVKHLKRAVGLQSQNPVFHNNLGEALRRQGKPKQALKAYQKALALNPGLAEAHYNLANILKDHQRLTEAIEHYQQAISLRPTYANALHNLGNVYLELGRYKSAMAAYERCLALTPDHAEAHNNLGITLQEWDRTEEALASYQRAVQLKPDFKAAQRNLAGLLEKQGKLAEAQPVYHQLAALEPDNLGLRLRLATMCPVVPTSNDAIDAYRAVILAALEQYGPHLPLDIEADHQTEAAPPSLITYQGRSDLALKQQWAALVGNNITSYYPKRSRGKPHVGFVVTAGHEGVFLKCMRGLINNFPTNRFNITVVCGTPIGEQVIGPALNHSAVKLLPLRGKLPDMAHQLRQANFDILHYWEVGTDATNYFLPFYRLAPVQCTTWGWPTTSGIPAIDYFVSCDLLEPNGSEHHYSEQLIRLPHLPTYYYRPPVPETNESRSHFGLTEDQHLYLCQQNLRKVQPDFDPLAAEILRRDPQGVLLFIQDKEPHITSLLRQRLKQTLPDVIDRVRFLPRLSETDYLNLLALVEVSLDTLHYTGGANTTYDALAVGTPIVTLPTQFHRGRYTTAAYQQMGMTDCVADSPAQYVELALALGTDPAYRAKISHHLSQACPVLFEDQQAVTELADFFETALAQA